MANLCKQNSFAHEVLKYMVKVSNVETEPKSTIADKSESSLVSLKMHQYFE